MPSSSPRPQAWLTLQFHEGSCLLSSTPKFPHQPAQPTKSNQLRTQREPPADAPAQAAQSLLAPRPTAQHLGVPPSTTGAAHQRDARPHTPPRTPSPPGSRNSDGGAPWSTDTEAFGLQLVRSWLKRSRAKGSRSGFDPMPAAHAYLPPSDSPWGLGRRMTTISPAIAVSPEAALLPELLTSCGIGLPDR